MEFSIIIPAHNEEEYIECCLKSIKNQTYKNYETIVICDDCNDNTKKIAKKYAKKIFSINKKNAGEARNFGAKKALGNTLIFIDADVAFSNKNILDKIKENINNKQKIGTCKFIPDKKTFRFNLYKLAKNSVTKYGMANGILFCKKDLFNKINGYSKKEYPEEHGGLIKRAREHTKFFVLKEPVIVSMRRYENLGLLKSLNYWAKIKLFKVKKSYPIIR